MPYARDSFFAGRADEFTTLADMQTDAVRWCAEVANQRRAGRLDRVAPQDLFDAEEKARLLALPRQRRSSWPGGRRPKVHARHPRQGGQGALQRAVALHRQAGRRPAEARTVEIYLDGTLVEPPMCASSGASRPTTTTTRPRRSPS